MRLVVAVWLVVLATLGGAVRAEHLAARVYTTVDGLSNDRVDRGARDRSGFLWFATYEGVSRFDGEHFVRFGVGDGLPASETHDVLVARDGMIWVATDAGVAWLDPSVTTTHPRFTPIGTRAGANALHEAADGTIWAGTDEGLVRVRRPGGPPAAELVLAPRPAPVLALASDPRDGTLWFGTWSGLWQRDREGHTAHYPVAPAGERDDRVSFLVFDRHGRLWVAHTSRRIFAVTPHPGTPLAPPDVRLWDAVVAAGGIHHEPSDGVRRGMFEDSRGTIWIGTGAEVVTYDDAHGFRAMAADALPIGHALAPCVEDAAGNLWFGSNAQGLVRYAPGGFTTFTRADGLESNYIHGFVETGGALYAVSWDNGHVLARFDGTRFTAVRPRQAPGLNTMAWGWGQTVLRDRDGAWWYPTADGVERYAPELAFEALATTAPVWLASAPRLPGRDIYRLYEDRRGDVWIGTLSDPGLARWSRATGEVGEVAGLPRGVVVAFAEDAHGALWIAYTDRLMRVRDGAPPEVVAAKQLPPGDLQALLVDRRGRLWIAINDGGIVRIDDPAAARPRLVRYSVADGLASDQAMTLVEDAIGRIYVGTTHGIDRIEPDAAPGAPIAHFDIADGLPNDYVFTSIRTRDGVLWFGTKDGAARLDPRDAVPTVLPPTYLAGVAIDGQALPTPLAGARGLELELGPHSDQLDLTFTIPVFAVGDPVKFQYRLDGADSAWSAPVRERGVHYARLAPGSYQFNVRAVAASGAVAEPATVVFTVLAPIWQRGWFIALCGLAIGAATYVVVRGRLRHALAIERVRTRIATDLHDELGANLSRISILSEVAVRRTGAAQSASTQIDEIGKSARELVDVAADIVWSTDPRRDDLGSVIARLRAFAGDVLEGREVEWTFTAPREPGRIKLDPDQRRHLYLIAKEAIHNVAKHAGARRVEIAIAEHERGVRLVVRDDGRGFDPASDAAGNGLANMRARAREAGGSLVVESRTGDGTTIAFTSTRRR